MSPMPGRSTLITSAPNQASICVQVGPAWTWLRSRMRTPSSALPAAPHGLVEGFGKACTPFVLPLFLAVAFFSLGFAFLLLFLAMVRFSLFISCEARFAG